MAPFTKLLVDKYFDSESAAFITDPTVFLVSKESGLIHDVYSSSAAAEISNADVIDLRGLTVLPGLVDTHVHLFLHSYAETPWETQVTKENLVERTIRAANHAKRTLLAGYTSVRDLGTEGAFDADITLRDCISYPKALTPGPCYFVANRAIVSSGSYGPKSSLSPHEEGVDGITGAQVADGIEACVRAVRKQIGAGADWWANSAVCTIKMANTLVQDKDYAVRSRMSSVAPQLALASVPLFSRAELAAMIEAAHTLGVKAAAHSNNPSAINNLIDLGIDSIEHGYCLDKTLLDRMAIAKITWNPTLAAYNLHPSSGNRWKMQQDTFKAALDVKQLAIACGGDTGVFDHGLNSKELVLMHKLGMAQQSVLQSATLRGWECIRSKQWEGEIGQQRLASVHLLREDRRVVGDNEMPFGVLKKGFAADVIATDGCLENQFEQAISPEHITFVMKTGVVYKRGGHAYGDAC